MTGTEIARYSRHLLLRDVGDLGQRRLRNARVCVVGAGGLGSPVLQYLAAAGVGRIGIVDSDDVELSNLQRQVIHGVADLGRPKVLSAADAVAALDPGVQVVTHHLRLTAATAVLLADYDVVVDGTDNFETRYLVNDACVRWGLPEVWGSVLGFDAQVSVFWGRPPAESGVAAVQLRDLFPVPPAPGAVPSCADAGVLGALCGQVGTVMATEVVKLVLGIGRPLLGRVLVMDALEQRWSEVALVGDPPGAHSQRPAPTQAAVCPAPDEVPTLTPPELARLLARGGEPATDVVLVDVREPLERVSLPGPRSLAVPIADILAGSGLSRIPDDRPVVLLCRSGARSELAGRALRAAGFTRVSHLEGGVLAWVAQVGPGQHPTGGPVDESAVDGKEMP